MSRYAPELVEGGFAVEVADAPLLHDGLADVFDGVPLGVSQRGDVIAVGLPGANLVYGGLMGQGKSNAARVTMLGAALDPLAVLWVFVFANNGDFDAYQPRLARYHRGVDDQVAEAALDGLRELYSMVSDREGRLADLGAKKVTHALAARHPVLRPVVALFSECHELFGHPVYGRDAADLAVQTLRRGRKTAITLAFDTQSSRADAIPPRIVELVKINACFAVKAWRSNDGFLGDGSFQAGIRATELRPGKDVGTSIVTGASPERSRSSSGSTSRPTTTPATTPQLTSSPAPWATSTPWSPQSEPLSQPRCSHGTCWPIW